MGNTPGKTQDTPVKSIQPPPIAPESGCPMKVSKSTQNSLSSGCPMKSTETTKETTTNTYKNPNVYNVYSQKIDPTNQMPVIANQNQAPGQTKPLETTRVQSTIPKGKSNRLIYIPLLCLTDRKITELSISGGTDDQTWLYPSPQMFWNALVRKHKQDGASEDDMDTIVAIHNNMNEATWKQLLSW